jgi:hypothetical protein
LQLTVKKFTRLNSNILETLDVIGFLKQALVQDLQIAKRSTWDEREKQSSKYQNERKTNLANKVNHWKKTMYISQEEFF